MDRTTFLAGSTAAVLARSSATRLTLAGLESRHGGRLGVFALDTGNGERLAHRADERFPMCSTFKMLLVAAVLARVDAGGERLDRRVAYHKTDLLPYAPITRANLGVGSMTVRALCAAAIEFSDNTAANLLLAALGGPERVTIYARSLGDTMTRLDRNEPALNSAEPGDERDTTTPAAMATTLRKLSIGSALSPSSRRALQAWLLGCRTGVDSLRAGVPAFWRVGDKTGSGAHATVNDIAVFYPPRRAPIFVTAYYTGSSASSDPRDEVLADVGRIVVTTFASSR